MPWVRDISNRLYIITPSTISDIHSIEQDSSSISFTSADIKIDLYNPFVEVNFEEAMVAPAPCTLKDFFAAHTDHYTIMHCFT